MTWHEKLQRKVKARLPLSLMDVPSVLLRRYVHREWRPGDSAREALLRVAHHLADDMKYYEMKNPAVSRRQQRFMCAEYGRLRSGRRSRSGIGRTAAKEFCMRRKKNPHLTSGRWRFVGMFAKADTPSVKRMLKIHGIKNRVTKDRYKGEKGMRELYVERAAWQVAYAAITRLFEVGRAA